MVRVPLSASDGELLSIVRSWLDVLAAGDYERVFDQLGYAMAWGAGSAGTRRDIGAYRAPDLYPGVSEFRVTDWRSAHGGNPTPLALVRRYAYSETLPIMATIEVDLPLNGRWSDLEADFVLMVNGSTDTEARCRWRIFAVLRDCAMMSNMVFKPTVYGVRSISR
ncbi:MAG: hypothetical protein FWG26_10400 [Betaproteobacteria bacterium]|nr:hypothetical protein [Betaproteobacteria bacterium]